MLVEGAAPSQPQRLILFEDLPGQTPQTEAVPTNPSLNPQTEPEDRVTSGFLTRYHLLEKSKSPGGARCRKRIHSLHRRGDGIVERLNDWVSLALVKLGLGEPKPFTDYALQNDLVHASPTAP